MHNSADIRVVQLKLRERFPSFATRYGISTLSLFGSRVRGDSRADSDLDILVRFDKTPSLLTFIKLENELSDLLGMQVDLVMANALRPDVATEVLTTSVPV
jgi:uncharacterized protein